MSTDRWVPDDGDGAPVVLEYAPDDETPTSIAVVRTIAALENVDPTALEFTLYDYIDPIALDRLIAHTGDGSTEVRFTIHGYRVSVRETGEIVVREPE
ncbi:HalOD1 output domain-containing protein [Haloterrigena salinisoli]|uniref:HalOD1 output domain-containing protein n=1 Tax=Haloterrigena salinisoli TaxID=3132747 RepID=UPI0030CF3077